MSFLERTVLLKTLNQRFSLFRSSEILGVKDLFFRHIHKIPSVLEIGYESDKLKPVYHISIWQCCQVDLKTDKKQVKIKIRNLRKRKKLVEMWAYNFFICSSASWYSLEIFVLISENDRWLRDLCEAYSEKSVKRSHCWDVLAATLSPVEFALFEVFPSNIFV